MLNLYKIRLGHALQGSDLLTCWQVTLRRFDQPVPSYGQAYFCGRMLDSGRLDRLGTGSIPLPLNLADTEALENLGRNIHDPLISFKPQLSYFANEVLIVSHDFRDAAQAAFAAGLTADRREGMFQHLEILLAHNRRRA